jgi:hypothetical protein
MSCIAIWANCQLSKSGVEPSVVTGGAGADQISQPLRNLAIRKPAQRRIGMLEQSREVGYTSASWYLMGARSCLSLWR